MDKTRNKSAQSVPARVMIVALPMTAWGLEQTIATDPETMTCVGVVSNAAEGVLRLEALQPDVVVFDLDGEEGIESLAFMHTQTPAKLLALTSSGDTAVHDSVVLAGARGVVGKHEQPPVLLKAISKVHAGEVWIDRSATSRIVSALAQQVSGRRDSPEKDRLAQLTPRERQTVIALASDAAAPGRILAQRLGISENTLRNHLTSIYSKLGVGNRVELYAFAHKHRLANPPPGH